MIIAISMRLSARQIRLRPVALAHPLHLYLVPATRGKSCDTYLGRNVRDARTSAAICWNNHHPCRSVRGTPRLLLLFQPSHSPTLFITITAVVGIRFTAYCAFGSLVVGCIAWRIIIRFEHSNQIAQCRPIHSQSVLRY